VVEPAPVPPVVVTPTPEPTPTPEAPKTEEAIIDDFLIFMKEAYFRNKQ
jgi:hypothetical protein